tara:strand:- start:10 stop:378 length:369 start_codon:yes stop_codon:yes gene_type:complete
MKLTRIVLPTSKPRQLVGFLSEFLDLEVIEHKTNYLMNFGSLELYVVDDEKVDQGASTSLEFQVDSYNELDELWQKYQFTLYRHIDNPVQGAVAPHEKDGRHQFEAIDIDGRCWRFVWQGQA